MRFFLSFLILVLINLPQNCFGFDEAPAPAPVQNLDDILKEASSLFGRTLKDTTSEYTLQKKSEQEYRANIFELPMGKHCLEILFNFKNDKLSSITCRTTEYVIKQVDNQIYSRNYEGGGVGTGTTYYCTPDLGLEIAIVTNNWAYFKIDDKCNKKARKAIEQRYDTNAAPPLIKMVTGEVAAVDANTMTLTIKTKKSEVTVNVDDETKIIMGMYKKSIVDVKVGDKITVKYALIDNVSVAKSIAIKSYPEPAPAPAPAPYKAESNSLREGHVYVQPFKHPKGYEDYINSLEVTYELFYLFLKGAFIFKDFNIYFQYCGQENAYSNPDIHICNEYVAKLVNNRMEMALPWIFFHEVGHTLLYLWGYPLWNNEDAADEFATVLLLMAGESGKKSAIEAIREWKTHPSFFESLAKVFINDRHSVSSQRARNISSWVNNSDELKRRWLKIFVPNMQTKALKSMIDKPESWMDIEFIKNELQEREHLQE